jgi:hypothetical protein
MLEQARFAITLGGVALTARFPAMALPRFIEIDGRRYLWRDLVAGRCSSCKANSAGCTAGRSGFM